MTQNEGFKSTNQYNEVIFSRVHILFSLLTSQSRILILGGKVEWLEIIKMAGLYLMYSSFTIWGDIKNLLQAKGPYKNRHFLEHKWDIT